ncbi:hypothetical protein As57867_007041, partial [Aphanomyces stellatus]
MNHSGPHAPPSGATPTKASARHGRFLRRSDHNVPTLSIPLKPTDKPVAHFPPSFYATLLKEYATKYLEQMHALPTPENIALVAQHMPLTKCRVAAAWKSRGCLSDVLTIDSRLHAPPPEGGVPRKEPSIGPATDGDDDSAYVEGVYGDDNRHVFGTDLAKNYCVEHVQWSFNDMKHRYVYPFNVIHKVPLGIDADGFPHAKPITFSLVPDHRVYKPSPAALDELFL